MALAAKTWNRHRAPEYKGGGTVWDGFAYDPDLKLVYFGTANAAPYDLRQLGGKPKDTLFTDSIVALHADTGRLAWYYQTTPGDHWDFDACQKLVLADLKIGNVTRPIIMQANKNGFFYVLDRRTGKLISAKNFTFVNWASRIDKKTGRPRLTKQANWYSRPKMVYPSWAGGHSWPPMSFNPRTGLVYIPVIDVPSVWVDLLHNGGRIKFINSFFTAIGVFPDETYDAVALKRYYGPLPDREKLEVTRRVKLLREFIRAWDPVSQKMVWEHETTSGVRGYDGGVMSTAGNLVFQGRGDGGLWIYAADSGKVLNTIQTGSHIMAAPMTYAVDGVQYVAVQVGIWRYGHRRRIDPAYECCLHLRKPESDHRLQARWRRRAEAAGSQGRALPKASHKRGEPRRDPGGGNQIYRAMLALPHARPEHYARSAEDAARGP